MRPRFENQQPRDHAQGLGGRVQGTSEAKAVGKSGPTLRRALDSLQRAASNLHRLWATGHALEAR